MPKHILVVDDEKEITELLKNHFLLADYDVTTENEPKKAAQLIREQDFPLVITDILMPEMTGIELIEEIKKHNSLTQIIVMTGYVTMGNILEAFSKGANNIFFKPFESLDEIQKEVEAAFNKIQRIKQVMMERLHYKA